MDMYVGPFQNCRDLSYDREGYYKVVLGHFWKEDQSPRSVHLTVEQIKRFNETGAMALAFGVVLPVCANKDRSVGYDLKDVSHWVKDLEVRYVAVSPEEPERGYYQEITGKIKPAPTVFGHLLNDLLRSKRKIAFGMRGPCTIVSIGESPKSSVLEAKEILGWDIVEVQDA